MSIAFLILAFSLGLAAKKIKLPPMVGYLAAGFVLNILGFEADMTLQRLADFGITLMLFTIGLKVNLKSLFQPAIWGTASCAGLGWMVVVIPLFLFGGAALGISFFDLDWKTTAIVVFALSFSSTVCVIKILEDHAELKSRHSDLSISVLIIQDLLAVLFLFLATGKMPSPLSVFLVFVLFLRPFINRIYDHVGHGELVPLSGILMALGGAALFEVFDLKGDLGALAAGMLIAGLPHSNEVYKSLISLKDIFLIGFFLTIGFAAVPTLEMALVAAMICLLLCLKFALFFFVITSFGLRARTAFLAGLLLSNFSEFGLIVASISHEANWISKEWLVIIALATAFSFVITSIAYQYAHPAFTKNKDFLLRFQRARASLPTNITPPLVDVLIVGMGRVGMGAYKAMSHDYEGEVWGIELDADRAERMKAKGFKVMTADGDDIEFWESIDLSKTSLVMLALPSTNEMKNILLQLKAAKYTGKISVVARYPDEQRALIALGADVAFNYYAEVGTGFADESRHLLEGK